MDDFEHLWACGFARKQVSSEGVYPKGQSRSDSLRLILGWTGVPLDRPVRSHLRYEERNQKLVCPVHACPIHIVPIVEKMIYKKALHNSAFHQDGAYA